MAGMINKLKSQVRVAEATLTGKIVQVPSDVKNFNCPNHWTSYKGKQVKMKMVIHFNPREKEYTCTCGTIYQKV